MIPLLAACAGPAGDPETVAPPLGLTPTWTAEEALATLQHTLDQALPDPDLARDTYVSLVEVGQDADCPGSMNFNGTDPQGCVSESGYLYAGLSGFEETPGEHWSLTGDFEIHTPDGRAFHGGGVITHGRHADGFRVELQWTWLFDGSEGWLDPGLSGTWSVQTSQQGAVLVGGITVEGVALYFEEVVLSASTEPALSGTLAVRDPAGAWWQLPLEDDGCGSVRFAGEQAAEGCVDLGTPLAAYAEVLEL